jgi:hypothetical protein
MAEIMGRRTSSHRILTAGMMRSATNKGMKTRTLLVKNRHPTCMSKRTSRHVNEPLHAGGHAGGPNSKRLICGCLALPDRHLTLSARQDVSRNCKTPSARIAVREADYRDERHAGRVRFLFFFGRAKPAQQSMRQALHPHSVSERGRKVAAPSLAGNGS